MAIRKVAPTSTSGNSLPFLNVWLDSMEEKNRKKMNGTSHLVSSVTIAQSGKGYTLATDSFNFWVWKNGAMGKEINEYLSIEPEEALLVVIDLSLKEFGLIAFDDEIKPTVIDHPTVKNAYSFIYPVKK